MEKFYPVIPDREVRHIYIRYKRVDLRHNMEKILGVIQSTTLPSKQSKLQLGVEEQTSTASRTLHSPFTVTLCKRRSIQYPIDRVY